MDAAGMFFDGTVEARIHLGRGMLRQGAGGADSTGGKPGGDASRPARSRHWRGGGMSGAGYGGGRPGGQGDSEESPSAARGAGRMRGATARAMPLMLHLTLENHGEKPVTVEVADFNSALGNFVVLPERYSLQPGGSGEAEPMTSRLGAASAEIPVTVRLKADGRSEQKVLTLKVTEPPPEKQPSDTKGPETGETAETNS